MLFRYTDYLFFLLHFYSSAIISYFILNLLYGIHEEVRNFCLINWFVGLQLWICGVAFWNWCLIAKILTPNFKDWFFCEFGLLKFVTLCFAYFHTFVVQQWSEPTNEAIQGLWMCSRSSQELDLQDLNIECVWLLVYPILLNQIQYLQLWSSIT